MYENESELWAPCCMYGKKYEVSSLGRVYNKDADTYVHPDKYKRVTLFYEGSQFEATIQVLMAGTFLNLDIVDPYHNRVLFKDGDSNHLNLDNIFIEDTSDLPGEVWKQVKKAAGRDVQDFYYVSNRGRVKSIKHDLTYQNNPHIVKPCPELILFQDQGDKGYYTVWLSAKQKPDITAQVHRLVAAAFCSNDDPEHKDVVNHKDGNPSNNKAENLEWCTQSENAQHAVRTGLRGDWKGRSLRYTVLHVEADKIYNSLSDIDKALGKASGYCSDCLHFGKPIRDKDGNVWTLEVFKDIKRKISTPGQHCTIEEFPGKEFISLSEASIAIGRWEGYISDALKRGSVIRNKAGQEMHIHLTGDAPVVGANEAYKQKKEAGLVPEKKKAKYLSKSNVHRPIKHVETGEIYTSFSAAARAMGRAEGYIGECFAFNRDFIDSKGVKWTFELLDEGSVTLHYKKNPCYIDELPGQEFANLTEASAAIGRNDTYINDRVRAIKPITSKEGQLIHFHYAEPEKEAKLQSDYYSKVDFNDVPKPKHKKLFNI